MHEYLTAILAAIPGLIAAIVAFLSKQAGKERREVSQEAHVKMEGQLAEILQRLDDSNAALAVLRTENNTLKRKNTALEKKINNS